MPVAGCQSPASCVLFRGCARNLPFNVDNEPWSSLQGDLLLALRIVGGLPGKILLVDDDPWIVRMVRTVLERRGHTVISADNGEDALARCAEEVPSLIVTDVNMPRMDGWTLVKTLRARPETALVPVVFLTALGSDEDRIKGFRLGADDYLPKPFRFEELDLRVQNALRRSQAARASAPAPASPALAGSLTEVGVASLLTLLDMERKTGALELKRGALTATLLLKHGRVMRAAVATDGGIRGGADGVYALLEWTSGDFRFLAAPVDEPDEVGAATTALLIEAARRMDERTAG